MSATDSSPLPPSLEGVQTAVDVDATLAQIDRAQQALYAACKRKFTLRATIPRRDDDDDSVIDDALTAARDALTALAQSSADRKAKPRLRTMGLSELARHQPEPGEVLISIGSQGERAPEEVSRYADVLRVEFDDDQWHQATQHNRGLKGYDAGNIVRFVMKHLDAPCITIHCTAGASRSVSVAQALALAFDIPHPPALILNYGAYFRTYDAAHRLLAARLASPARSEEHA